MAILCGRPQYIGVLVFSEGLIKMMVTLLYDSFPWVLCFSPSHASFKLLSTCGHCGGELAKPPADDAEDYIWLEAPSFQTWQGDTVIDWDCNTSTSICVLTMTVLPSLTVVSLLSFSCDPRKSTTWTLPFSRNFPRLAMARCVFDNRPQLPEENTALRCCRQNTLLHDSLGYVYGIVTFSTNVML